MHLIAAHLRRTASANTAPIIITGNPKSGTTAIAVLLGKATGKTVTSDVFYRLDRETGAFRERLFDEELTFHDLVAGSKFKPMGLSFWHDLPPLPENAA